MHLSITYNDKRMLTHITPLQYNDKRMYLQRQKNANTYQREKMKIKNAGTYTPACALPYTPACARYALVCARPHTTGVQGVGVI